MKLYIKSNNQRENLFWYSKSLVHGFHYSTIISTKNKPLYPFGIGICIWAAKN